MSARATQTAQVGVIGLGAMGAGLVRNLIERDIRVAGHDRDPGQLHALADGAPRDRFAPAEQLDELLERLERPRRILLLVPAGSALDELIDRIDPRLAAGDVLIDGGNSHFRDTARRIERAAGRPWQLVGMGISGGPEGARTGPSLMPGGSAEQFHELRPLLESIAARSHSGPCVTHCGRGAAGHFVKMVHNGIEYGEMQLLGEACLLLRRGLEMSVETVAEVFESWNESELESYLLEISARILRMPDPREPGRPLIDAILDRADQGGTGRWTVEVALELGVSVPTIAAAVDARVLSSDAELRRIARQAPIGAEEAIAGASLVDDVRQALHAARIANLSQGFELLRAASEAFGYGIPLAEIARIWKAGCIIRSRLLDDAERALASCDGPLAFAPGPSRQIAERGAGWRRLVSAACRAGLPVPALAASLQWLDTLSTPRTSAALIQAQRDFFGAHGYERIDEPGERVHTDWGKAR